MATTKTIDDGGPAFPMPIAANLDGFGTTDEYVGGDGKSGMSLRAWFAGQFDAPSDMESIARAIMGEMPPPRPSINDLDDRLEWARWWATARARFRVMEADAMIEALKGGA